MYFGKRTLMGRTLIKTYDKPRSTPFAVTLGHRSGEAVEKNQRRDQHSEVMRPSATGAAAQNVDKNMAMSTMSLSDVKSFMVHISPL
jgi:hypothetical protein